MGIIVIVIDTTGAEAGIIKAGAGSKDENNAWKCNESILDKDKVPVPFFSRNETIREPCYPGADKPSNKNAYYPPVAAVESVGQSIPYYEKSSGHTYKKRQD